MSPCDLTRETRRSRRATTPRDHVGDAHTHSTVQKAAEDVSKPKGGRWTPVESASSQHGGSVVPGRLRYAGVVGGTRGVGIPARIWTLDCNLHAPACKRCGQYQLLIALCMVWLPVAGCLLSAMSASCRLPSTNSSFLGPVHVAKRDGDMVI